MGREENPLASLLDNRYEQKWHALVAPLALVSLGAALYKIHTRDFTEEDLFPGYRETIDRLREAGRNPGDFFYPLPGRRLRSIAMIRTFQGFGERKPVRYIITPVLAAFEWTIGQLHLQHAVVENKSYQPVPGVNKRSQLFALVGDHNAFHKIEAQSVYEARVDIERIVSLHKAGRKAVEAKYR